MTRTLAISLLLGLAASAMAQTPTTNGNGKANTVVAAPQKPAPGTKADPAKVKVIAVPQGKPVVGVAAKPAVVVQPKPAVAAVPAKAVPAKNPTPAHAVAAATKPSVSNNSKVAVAPAPAKATSKDPFNGKKAPVVAVKVASPNNKQKAVVAKPSGTTVAVNEEKPKADKKPEVKKIVGTSRRDPFTSPVVTMGAVGAGCNSGKRCLAIDQIALRGVVKSDNGMIAVVVNALDKAYFLRENDPVFNGYVMKITGDSIVFKETFHDKLGKPLTRDVTKTINRPAA